jgi:CspA family cold shock protein
MNQSSNVVKSLLVSIVVAPIAALVIGGQDLALSSNVLILFIFMWLACVLSSLNIGKNRVGAQAKANIAMSKPLHKKEGVSENTLVKRDAGQVKWFNSSKGFGFITREDGQDIFVHFRSIRGDGRRFLRDGQKVDFVTGHGEKGLQAEDVILLEK